MDVNVLGLAVLAAEEFVPPTDWRAQVALPAGIVIFLGSIFLLLRSNLGTRRAYLLEASSFFGFMVILSLFWAFGAPGTPQNTGPQNLPGQQQGYYLPTWVPFAVDSTLAEERFPEVRTFPEGFEAVPPEQEPVEGAAEDEGTPVGDTGLTVTQVVGGADEIRGFFATEDAGAVVEDDWLYEPTEIQYTVIDGFPVIGVSYVQPDPENPTEPAPDAEPYTAFAFYDAGFPMLPSLIFIVLSVLGFVLHVALLVWDENRERREREGDHERRVEEAERVPVSA